MKQRAQKQLEALPGLRFAPAMDWWVLLLAVTFLIGLFLLVVSTIWYSVGSPALKTVTALALLVTIIYLVDVFFYSSYILNAEGLIIHGNLRHVLIPYRSMRELKSGGLRALVTIARHKRYALSRRNIVIKLQNEAWSSISLSPKHKDAFITALLQRIDLERAQRAVRVHSKK